MVQFIPVKSSNLTHIGYMPRTRVLFVRFKSGEVWRYLDVSLSEYNALHDSKSKGKFFVEHIKPIHEGELAEDAPEPEEETDAHGIVVIPSANRGGKVTEKNALIEKHLQDRNGHNVDAKGRLLYDELCSFCHPDSKPKSLIRTGQIEL